MSRIGKKPIALPKGVEVKITGKTISVKGPKGQLTKSFHDATAVKVEGSSLLITSVRPSGEAKKYHGLTRTLVSNMVEGVTTGFSKSLTMVGVGYRAQPKGKDVTLSLGYSHPIDFQPPTGIEIKVDKQTTLIISGADKETVGLVAAKIRSLRPPEPYHGKGVRYSDEVIETKEGKASGKK